MHARSLITATLVLAAGTALGLTAASSGEPAPAERPVAFVLQGALAHAPPRPIEPPPPPEPAVLETLQGSASYYANSLAGRRTASGVRYDPRRMIAAHRSLPFGSLLRVTNQANGRSVEVRVVDRGPFARGRVLDLSRVAAERLGFIRQGHTRVTVEVLEYGG